jgi:hypothetical protein
MKRKSVVFPGEIFNELTVIEEKYMETNNGTKVAKCLCRCSCGVEKWIKSYAVKNGWSKSCGHLQVEKAKKLGGRFLPRGRYGKQHQCWKGYENIPGRLWCDIKNGAKHRNIGFEISIQEANDLFNTQEGKCLLTGEKINLDCVENGKYNRHLRTASLDRVDSNEGYTKDNVQWLHRDVNKMKQGFSNDILLDICKLIINHISDSFLKDEEIRAIFTKINSKYTEIDIFKESKFKKRRGSNSPIWKGFGEISNRYWTAISGRIKKGVEITIEDAWNLFLDQDRKCAFSGMELCMHEYKDCGRTRTASLDRIDSSKGYIIDNIQWVHKNINCMKQDLDQSVFLEWCRKIVSHSLSV